MNQFNFDKNMTNVAKGLAIFLMIYHHLFAFPERISSVDYIPLFMFGNMPIDQLFGLFGKLTVAIFLFLSGYGLYKTFESKGKFDWKDSFQRIVQFYFYYLAVFLLFVPVGLFFFQDNARYIFDFKDFLFNLLTLKSTYNGEWWFVSLYIELLICFPFLAKMMKKAPVLLSYISFVLLFFAGFFSRLLPQFPYNEYAQIALTHLSALLFWQFVFLVGMYFAKYSCFDKMNNFFTSRHLDSVFTYLFLFVFCFFSRQFLLPYVIKTMGISNYNIYNYADFILAPILIFSFVKMVLRVKVLFRMFAFLGKHSNNIWLTHTFFAYHFMEKVVFYPRYSILIVIWLFVITIVSSYIVDYATMILKKILLIKKPS